jgi:hypothetical protein
MWKIFCFVRTCSHNEIIYYILYPRTTTDNVCTAIALSDDHEQQANTSFYSEREELFYDVSWSGIRISMGDFKGWFSDDTAVIPITAEMKVILGSVKIELNQWNRKGWNSPE